MRDRDNVRTLLLGLLPAILALTACTTTANEPNEEQNEIRPSEAVTEAVTEVKTETTVAIPTGMKVTATEEGESTTSPPARPMNRPPAGYSENNLTYQTMILADGSQLEFALLLPRGFYPTHPYPVLLALPPGTQTKAMVDAGFDGYWTAGASGRDWIVISPIAPDGQLFFRGSETVLPEFLEEIEKQFVVEGDRYHLAGISNGGISAFRIATLHPELFHSIVVLPGFPVDNDFEKLDRLSAIPVSLFVGEFDSEWVREMTETQQELQRLQVNSTLEVIPGSGHVITKINGEQIFDLFDGYR